MRESGSPGQDKQTIESFGQQENAYPPPEAFRKSARLASEVEYQRLYDESLNDPETFWRRELSELILDRDWTTLVEGALPRPRWFVGARLNASVNCLDRFADDPTATNRPALLFEGEAGDKRVLDYGQLRNEVVRLASALRSAGVGVGDRVAIYMGMVPEAVVAMLACARIGAVHTVVFGGFAADALRDRIVDSEARVVLTQDGAWRRGKVVPLKETVDKAIQAGADVRHVFVFRRVGAANCPLDWIEGRDLDWQEVLEASDPTKGTPEVVDAEHPLFILYTSGSTGRPKGVLHTTLGYLAGAHLSTKYIFDLRPDDVYFCTADIGWITGHTYLTYGPLSNGATILLYEGAPNQPDWSRIWRIVESYKVSILYTAPTAIRAFIKAGESWLDGRDLSSLRLLGTVGEPINPEAWRWYYEHIGGKCCPIVDTWWQTETGSILLTTLPGVHPAKPGSAGVPFFGVEADVVSSEGESLRAGEGGRLVLKRAWPSMLRGIWGDNERLEQQYFSEIAGAYFSGDGARRDADGYFTVVGRIDDVLNVSGHRIGTAEIESCLVLHPAVAEAAAVGRPDDLKGQALVVFVTLKPGYEGNLKTQTELGAHVAQEIGKFARPDDICLVDALPKTRSGKIMRRILKNVAAREPIQGDLSTLEDNAVVERIQTVFDQGGISNE